LTATLVREDGREDDVFSLIGPKKYDVAWKTLAEQGWIATADCTEIRINLNDEDRILYATAEKREKIRIGSENRRKAVMVERLLKKHHGERILIIGQYLDQIHSLAQQFSLPLITGQTPAYERDEVYQKFRTGEIPVLVVSKVGNFAIDLPDATILIQVSGTFGSRQEEAQRLGRILRPKAHQQIAHFYSLVTRETRDQEFAMNRQLFLTEQGYTYKIINETDANELF
jgi:DNA excision repair protein ERCC-3